MSTEHNIKQQITTKEHSSINPSKSKIGLLAGGVVATIITAILLRKKLIPKTETINTVIVDTIDVDFQTISSNKMKTI